MKNSLILASTSVYRVSLLSRLQIPFVVEPPGTDETPMLRELPACQARRLALAKARAVAQRFVGATVVGSDQVAALHGQAIGKPLTHTKATEQLRSLQGQRVVFHTGVAVVRCGPDPFEESSIEHVHVQFRDLNDEDIAHYLGAEPAYDCAGSAKAEGLGIALMETIESNDPTALIGLPLIACCKLLRAAGIDPLRASPSTLHSFSG